MIPRLRPYVGWEELRAIAVGSGAAHHVRAFESAFARRFDTLHAVAFPYGRSALWAFLKSAGLQGMEVIQPAYTCVVVSHAIVLSGNVPRFVDVSPFDYNMDLDQVEAAINRNTGAILATHLFGYPLDIDRLGAIVVRAEARIGRKIWIVHDCAHAFGARWNGRLVTACGDAAIFGLGISKLITSIFGGVLTTADDVLHESVRAWRDGHFTAAGPGRSLRRRLYLAAASAALCDWLYGAVRWLQDDTRLLDRFTRAYHLDDKIHFPPDYEQAMSGTEAQIGLIQLGKYDEIVRRRQEHARAYDRDLRGVACLQLPPLLDGATYSHYVARVPDRDAFIAAMRAKGIELGRLIDYNIPEMACYRRFAHGQAFPNASRCSRDTINLPVHASLSATQRNRVIHGLRDIRRETAR